MQLQLVHRPETENPLVIEFHGNILPGDGGLLRATQLGHLEWLNDNEAIVLIGGAFLHGKVVDMDKPMLLVKPPTAASVEDGDTVTVSHTVTKKLVFKNKPVDIADGLLQKVFKEIDVDSEAVDSLDDVEML